ncbi:MAG: hypothetical protein KJ666_16980 [Bacteroidetes bacterium]|nr:hypothetical protein [Bacteroidota bacterium]
MRRKVLFIALTLSLNIFAFNLAEAKPTYCYDAFWDCMDKCHDYFGWFPIANLACASFGCAAGFNRCGGS